jgi:hypothetical protein
MVERVNGTIKNATVKAMTYQNIDEILLAYSPCVSYKSTEHQL